MSNKLISSTNNMSLLDLKDLNRITSLEICKRLLQEDKSQYQGSVNIRLNFKVDSGLSQKDSEGLLIRALANFLKDRDISIGYGSKCSIENCTIYKTSLEELAEA